MKETDQNNTALWIASAVIGFITYLPTVWITAYMADSKVLAESPYGGPGAILVAMFICTPASIVIGPISGIVGARIGKQFGKNIASSSIYGGIGAGLFGLAVGAFPFICDLF